MTVLQLFWDKYKRKTATAAQRRTHGRFIPWMLREIGSYDLAPPYISYVYDVVNHETSIHPAHHAFKFLKQLSSGGFDIDVSQKCLFHGHVVTANWFKTRRHYCWDVNDDISLRSIMTSNARGLKPHQSSLVWQMKMAWFTTESLSTFLEALGPCRLKKLRVFC